MELQSQLLCTFVSPNDLDGTMIEIQKIYNLVFNKIYVLENIQDSNQLVLTYNVEKNSMLAVQPLHSTISVHRKKLTNTIYTINAINRLIEEKNNGVLDKSFKINWEELQNMVLVTAYTQLKIIKTKLSTVISL